MNRKLKAVEALPSDSAQNVLGLEATVPQDDENDMSEAE
jgi:DNA recombination protein RmuC